MSLRDDDIALLKEVLDTAKLAHVHDTFENMLLKLQEHPTWTLTAKQRSWAQELVGKPVYENLASSGKAPRGREVPTPVVLRRENLPMKPPGRR